jgi:protein-S-isoprenylcysteine O-methyltransferase Ste14
VKASFFGYFQLIGVIFFLLVFVGRTLFLRFKKGIVAISLGVGKKGLKKLVELLFFVVLLAWMAEIILYSVNSKFLLFPGILSVVLLEYFVARVFGVFLLLVSFILFVWALISFGDSWRVGIDNAKPGQLVDRGAFAISRNPIFTFIDLYFIGTFLINGTLVFALFALTIIAGLHYQIVQEERFLKQQYGNAYKLYVTRTMRYFGRRRRG